MSETERNQVEVSVRSRLVASRSNPSRNLYFYAYTVTIINRGEGSCKLLTRHWKITDAAGRVEEVDGVGVVGKQPLIAPGDRFTYTSGCPMHTPIGSMQGRYRMVDEDGEEFDVEIPAFALLAREQDVN